MFQVLFEQDHQLDREGQQNAKDIFIFNSSNYTYYENLLFL